MDVLRALPPRIPQPHRRAHRLPCAGQGGDPPHRRPATRSRGPQCRKPGRDADVRWDAGRSLRGRRLQARIRRSRAQATDSQRVGNGTGARDARRWHRQGRSRLCTLGRQGGAGRLRPQATRSDQRRSTLWICATAGPAQESSGRARRSPKVARHEARGCPNPENGRRAARPSSAASLRTRGEYAPHPVVTTCWSADIARQMTTCFGMDEGLDWRKRRSDRDF